jgi:glycine dehydrogenase
MDRKRSFSTRNSTIVIYKYIFMDTNKFVNRHIGISEEDLPEMLKTVGVSSLDQLIDQTIPAGIRLKKKLNLPDAMTERELAEHLSELASKNEVFTSYIGMGWYDTVCPAPIMRNVLENPVWYTSYTPYQAEVSQGRLEALLNFQTVITELTGLPLANCSLLDEATAAAEAMTMFHNTRSRDKVKAGANSIFVDESVFASTQAVIHTRMIPQGIHIVVGDYKTFEFTPDFFGALVQFPNDNGEIVDYKAFVAKANAAGVKVAVAADLMSLVLLTPPGEWGADVVLGSSQRFGIPMFFGGPSAAYFRYESRIQTYHSGTYHRNFQGCLWTRSLPPRSPDTRTAYQTREGYEQHLYGSGSAGYHVRILCHLSRC